MGSMLKKGAEHMKMALHGKLKSKLMEAADIAEQMHGGSESVPMKETDSVAGPSEGLTKEMSDNVDQKESAEEEEKELGTPPQMSAASDVKDNYDKDEAMVHQMMSDQHNPDIKRPLTIKEKAREAMAMKTKGKMRV